MPTTNRDDFLTYEWVDLHSGDYFNGVVAYLRGLLDKEGTLIDDEGKAKCKAAFLRAIQLEEDFFEMAYAGSNRHDGTKKISINTRSFSGIKQNISNKKIE